jgi:hypothetical protein
VVVARRRLDSEADRRQPTDELPDVLTHSSQWLRSKDLLSPGRSQTGDETWKTGSGGNVPRGSNPPRRSVEPQVAWLSRTACPVAGRLAALNEALNHQSQFRLVDQVGWGAPMERRGRHARSLLVRERVEARQASGMVLDSARCRSANELPRDRASACADCQ